MPSAAVVGLGIMGGTIARHLVHAGFDVSGFDPSSLACRAAQALGVDTVIELAQLPANARILILSLPSFDAARSVVDELAHLKEPRILVETSTLALEEKFALRDRLSHTHHKILDCPISGTGSQIVQKDVVVYASGEDETVKRAEEVLATFSRQVLNLGAFGNGTRMKLIANHLVAVHNVAAAEAVLLGMKAGFSLDLLLAAIGSGAGNSRMFELRGPNIAEQRYLPAAMKLSLWSKDMDLIRAFVKNLDVATPLFDAVVPLYAQALREGRGDEDTSAVAEVLRAGRRPPATPEAEGD